MKTLALFGVVFLAFVQNNFGHPGVARIKRQDYEPDEVDENFAQVFEELAEIDNDIDEAKNEIIEHIHEHVETRLEHHEDLLKQIKNNQRYMWLCRLDGNPCQNGGSCQYDEETDNYRCQCSEEWTGTNCEESTNPCYDVDCHSGECRNGTCFCRGIYLGDHCEYGTHGICLQALEQYNALEFPMPGMEEPRCDHNGAYAPYQFRGSQAVCVTLSGEFLDYSLDRWDTEYERMECKCAREEYEHLYQGTYNCAPDGSFYVLL